jgi:hypothetical protein
MTKPRATLRRTPFLIRPYYYRVEVDDFREYSGWAWTPWGARRRINQITRNSCST